MGGLVPAVRLGDVVLGMGIASLLGSASLAWRLRPSTVALLPIVRRYGLVVVSLVIYGAELWDGLQLQRTPDAHAPLNNLTTVIRDSHP